MSVPAASWRLSVADICNGNGVAVITLRSGVQLRGIPDQRLSQREVLHLRQPNIDGWSLIDWDEIAAVTGERYAAD